MKTNPLKLSVLVFSALVFLVSCDGEDDRKLTADEAKDVMTSIDTELSNELQDFTQADGFLALQTLASLSGSGDPFPFRTFENPKHNPNSQIRTALFSFQNMIRVSTTGSRLQDDESFDYMGNLGLYVWNFEIASFVKADESEIIEIQFPTEGSEVNNAVFKLTDYEEVYTPDGDEEYSISKIEASLDIDNIKQASISATVEYKNDGSDDASFADLTYFVNPYTLTIDLDDRQPSISTFSQFLSKANTVLLGWSITATYSGSKLEENISKIVGTLQLGSVIFKADISTPTLTDQLDYNDFVKITISIDGRAAGKIIWVTPSATSDPIPYVEFTDGTKVMLIELFEMLGASLSTVDIG